MEVCVAYFGTLRNVQLGKNLRETREINACSDQRDVCIILPCFK